MSRITAAMERIDAARADTAAANASPPAAEMEAKNSAKVMSLINTHEKLREEVADTLGELDALIEELEA